MPSPLNEAAPMSGCDIERSRSLVVLADDSAGEGAPTCYVGSRVSRRVADAAYVTLVTVGWLTGNILGVLGCAVAAFIVLSHGQWDAFFLHIDNLASRYVAADTSRRMMFEHILVQVFVVLFVAISLFRAGGFIRRIRSALAEGVAK